MHRMKRIQVWCVTLVLALLVPGVHAETVEYIHTDALGSPVAITNEAGQVIERTDYEPYGSMIGKANNDRPGYTGHVMDSATGLTYMQQRYYDPSIGRFLSVDPVTAYEKPLTNFNRYVYGLNNPYKFTDPDGRDVTCNQNSCTIRSHSILEAVVDWGTVGVIYTRRLIENAINSGPQRSESSEGNTNPYEGPVDSPVTVVDQDGNAIPVGEGEQVTSSPNADYQQVRDKDGNPTGVRLDRGGHKGQSDPQARDPHAHRPGVTDGKGNPHLPIRPPREPREPREPRQPRPEGPESR